MPLDTPLALEPEGETALRVRDGETPVAEARRIDGVGVEPPEAVGIEQARRASHAYRASADGPFSRSFVCGPARENSFGVFAGPVPGRDLVASPWTPPTWAAGEDGAVGPEFAWAVLDCPTYFAAHPGPGMPLSFLVQAAAEVRAPIAVGVEHVVIAWPLGAEGRKHRAGAAILSAGGETLAVARALLVEARRSPD